MVSSGWVLGAVEAERSSSLPAEGEGTIDK